MPYDLVILDVHMPELTGDAALLQIKGLQSNIKAFFITGTLSRREVADLAVGLDVPPENLPDGTGYIVVVKALDALTAEELESFINALLDDRYGDLPTDLIVRCI